jgi:hypothetical protein
MLVICAPNPKSNYQDGYIQRVREIDSVLAQIPRAYLEKTKRWEHVGVKKLDDVTFKIVVPEGCDDVKLAAQLRDITDGIYIHSIYQFSIFESLIARLLPTSNIPVILDVHGIVPEETFFSTSNRTLELKWQRIEQRAVETVNALIFVTAKMKQYFIKKYQISKKELLEMPISRGFNKGFSEDQLNLKLLTYESCPRIAYAGGTQPWQRIDRMIQAIKKTDIESMILTSDKKEFRTVKGSKVVIKTTDTHGVINELSKAHFAFVLRESNVINSVACPTKLIEALTYGCLPVVESEDLGDFKSLGYKYLSLEDFELRNFPTLTDFKSSIIHNRAIIESLQKDYSTASQALISLLPTKVSTQSEVLKLDALLKAERSRVLRKLFLTAAIFSPRESFRLLRYLVSKNAN